MKTILISVLFVFASHSALGALRTEDMASELFSFFGLVDDPSQATVTGSLDELIDPQGPADGVTFKQRYYVNSFYASGPDAPVLYYICGEAPCTPGFVTKYVGELASHLHAHIVSLEHRYYGASKPFAKLDRKNIQYLTVRNALADLARFQGFITRQKGLTGPWIVIGGSYAGDLSSYYRLTHPELVVGSLASSAPVEARLIYPEFDYHAATHVPDACRRAVLAIDNQVAATLSSPEALAKLKTMFGADNVRDPKQFLFFVSDFAAESVQYGRSVELCNRIDPAHPLESYAAYVSKYLKDNGGTPSDFSYEPKYASNGVAVLEGSEWTYQSCRDFGFWQTPWSVEAQSMRSPQIQLGDFQAICADLFGIYDAGNEAINANNEVYYHKLMDPSYASNIIFTNGSEDPWSELSIAEFRGNHRNPKTETIAIEGGSHCSDLHVTVPSDPASFGQARSEIEKTIRGWLSQ